MATALKVLIFITCAFLVYAEEDIEMEDKVKAIKATRIGIANNAEDTDARAPACAIRCSGGVWCCNWSAPICSGYGMCCPRNRPTLWGSYCV